MRPQSRSKLIAILLLAATLVLAACERPFQTGEPQPVSPADQTAETTTDQTAVTGTTTASEAEVATVEGETTTAEEVVATAVGTAEEVVDGAAEAVDEAVVTDSETATTEATAGTATDTTTDTTAAGTDTATDTTTNTTTDTATDTSTTTETTAAETTAATGEQTYTVKAGDNLYRIGLNYGVSYLVLANYNGIPAPYVLLVGQVIKIPGTGTPTPTPTPNPTGENTYTVKAGDNLYRIGLNFGVDWQQIAEANGIINPNQIVVGQVLKIPASTPGPTPAFTHVVQPGQTLFLISLRYGVTWQSIAEANKLTSPYVIYPGQVLTIPGS